MKLKQQTLTTGIKPSNCISNNERIWKRLITCKSYRDQVSFVSSIVPDKFSLDTVGILFGTKRNGISNILNKQKKQVRGPGRPLVMTQQLKESINELLLSKNVDEINLTLDEITKHIFDEFHITVCKNTVSQCLKDLGYKLCRVVTEEEGRIVLDPIAILNNYNELHENNSDEVLL